MTDEHRQPANILSELLVLQAQGGSDSALSQLVDIWTPRLKARAYRLTFNSDGACEVVQEAWIGIARGLRTLRDPSRFGVWSMRIVHHKAGDWIKVQSKHRALKSRLRDTHAKPNPADDEDIGQAIREAIGHLDPKLREVVYLFYMDNCLLDQIAAALEIPVGTAKTRLMRARTQLKPILEKKLERNSQ